MGRILIIWRLAGRDLRRRRAEAALLLLAITATTTALTLGLILYGVIDEPYQRTREATAGPDIVASLAPPPGGRAADIAALTALTSAPGVTAHSGPFPYTQAGLAVHGVTATAWVQGRDQAPALVDQPALTEGSWVSDGGAVLEATFAEALGIGTGDRITLRGRTFQVAGLAVTAASTPYPKVCFAPCRSGAARPASPTVDTPGPRSIPPGGPPRGADAFRIGPSGLVWLTQADVRGLVERVDALAYVTYLRLADPAGAPAFADAHIVTAGPALTTWQDNLDGHSWLIEAKRFTMLLTSWLLSVLALASIVVLIGGRMADQLRRVGLLKAVGGTPGLVAAVLLAEHAAVALLGAAAGLAIGRLIAPLLTDPGTGLLGGAGMVPFGLSTVAIVVGVAVGIAALATVVPAVRAARTSTVRALTDAAAPPRRTAWLIAMSTRMPVPLLLGLRVAARRPRRTVLGGLAVAITVSGIVAALATYAHRYAEKAPGADPRTALGQALALMAIMLGAQAAVNAVCIIWANALDTRRTSALARALGATPAQVSTGLSAAQVLPALVGALLGLAGGIGLAEVLDDDPVTIPPFWQLLAVVLGCVVVMTVLTAIPARFGARRPAGEILQAETA